MASDLAFQSFPAHPNILWQSDHGLMFRYCHSEGPNRGSEFFPYSYQTLKNAPIRIALRGRCGEASVTRTSANACPHASHRLTSGSFVAKRETQEMERFSTRHEAREDRG